jgi:DNA-binding transcriptional LysR family regulator
MGKAMLDPRLLRAFVAILDDASFTRAAERLHMTQSTISQQLARLEAAVGQPLVDREARPLGATPAGERLQGYARRVLALLGDAEAALGDPAGSAPIRIGLPEDILTLGMAALFRDFAAAHREARLDVVSGLSRELVRRFRAGQLDIAVVKEPAPSADARASFVEPMGWFEAEAARDWPDPIPLVVFPAGGLYREVMFERIERERRRWYVAFSGTSLADVLVATEAGLGVTLLPVAVTTGRRLRPAALGHEPAMAVSLYAWERTGPPAALVEPMMAIIGASRRGKDR